MRISTTPTGRTAPWIRPRHCGPCQMASPTWIISGSGGMTARLASSTNIAWWHRFAAPTNPGRAGYPATPRDQYAALLPVRERVSGAEHPYTLTARSNLAYWTRQAGTQAEQ